MVSESRMQEITQKSSQECAGKKKARLTAEILDAPHAGHSRMRYAALASMISLQIVLIMTTSCMSSVLLITGQVITGNNI